MVSKLENFGVTMKFLKVFLLYVVCPNYNVATLKLWCHDIDLVP